MKGKPKIGDQQPPTDTAGKPECLEPTEWLKELEVSGSLWIKVEEFADQAHILTRLTQSLHAWQEERRSHFQAYSLFTSDSNCLTEDVLL